MVIHAKNIMSLYLVKLVEPIIILTYIYFTEILLGLKLA